MSNAVTPLVQRRRAPGVPRRLVGLVVLGAVVAWAIVQGAHSHDGLGPVAADLSTAEVSRVIHIDASTGQLDLEDVAVTPGEVVEFVLDGSGGSGHRFVLDGLTGAAIDQRTAPNGDVIVRVQAPQSGALSFFCAVPGHEGLHGSLVVGVAD
ncbi:MAG: hypothetical protein OXG95_11710 [Chloroflexi bacterium]|nr:hypothetical protein [Chloroflexota bacterium]